MPQFSNCGAFLQVYRIFSRCRIFPSTLHFSKFGAFLKCVAFFQVPGIFRTVAHVPSAAFFQVCGIFPRVAHYFKCGAFLHAKCAHFPSMAHFPYGWRISGFRLSPPINISSLDRLKFCFFIGIIHDFLCSSNS